MQLPSFGDDLSLWDEVLPSLLSYPVEGGMRVMVFDWPGSASTSFDFAPTSRLYHVFADLLVSLLQELEIRSCIYVGHSMSAMIGCLAALTEPALFRKLILVGASPRYLNEEAYYGGFEQDDLNNLFDAMARDFCGWAEGFARAVVGTDAPDVAVRKFESTLSGMQPDTALAMAKAIFLSDFRSDIGSVAKVLDAGSQNGKPSGTANIVVLQTEKDLAVPLLVSDYLKMVLGDRGRVEVLQVEGHLPQLSAPETFNSALRRALLE
ncbi:hypothetical protein KP509_25G039400 [Ceratopteris richardii]|uniref:AB hydrolase-1 domain-containing protein n=1 Tax=Ceratopteris richardii TaxID=49495 RepID=A0A8T2RSF2_CERRI|nr:hypothetical protein KP509_25G039400 [Ceratopteris richardii]